jgi:hypothetical protein
MTWNSLCPHCGQRHKDVRRVDSTKVRLVQTGDIVVCDQCWQFAQADSNWNLQRIREEEVPDVLREIAFSHMMASLITSTKQQEEESAG